LIVELPFSHLESALFGRTGCIREDHDYWKRSREEKEAIQASFPKKNALNV